jgi:hypothetical protein
VVAPFDQVFPVALDDVSTTEPPAQKVVEPPAVTVGVVAVVVIVTLVIGDVELQAPFVMVTE